MTLGKESWLDLKSFVVIFVILRLSTKFLSPMKRRHFTLFFYFSLILITGITWLRSISFNDVFFLILSTETKYIFILTANFNNPIKTRARAIYYNHMRKPNSYKYNTPENIIESRSQQLLMLWNRCRLRNNNINAM